ncbi:uncharacterized protein LOC100897955 [Galendromus occidentalis]|uniref:Uncharacterized protein LOC100897955 n=1 Tax=Galendromus occidentalis TaxID=34638 RepID=A0AAJ6QMP8_9ACAR|nr:uncharacterized protein LOC100897955 [Galendromus occidentalis]
MVSALAEPLLEVKPDNSSASSSGCSSKESSSDEWLIKRSSVYESSECSPGRGWNCCSASSSCIGRWLLGKLSETITVPETLLLTLVVGVNFLSFCAGSMLAPVLPQHLTSKMAQFGGEGAASEVDVSIAFVLYAGTSMLFSLVFGPLISRFGINTFYYFGLSTVALTNIALGALDILPMSSYRQYIFAQCVVRTLEGIGAAAFNTSSHSIIMRVFSRNIDEAFAAVEAAVAISFSLGPVIGSFLVKGFGWFWAFSIFGTIVLATIPLSIWTFSNYGSMRYVDVSSTGNRGFLPLRIACTWNGIFVILCMLVTTTAFSFIEPTLELFLENILQNEYSIAFYFAEAAAFAVSALIVAPFLAARTKVGTMIMGTVLLAVAFLIIGPSKYFLREPNDFMTMAGVVLIGFSFALAYVPTLDYLVETAVNDLGCLKSPATYGPISGLWNFCNGFGETFGPVLAMFQTSSDFRDATLLISTTLFSSVIILMLIAFLAKRTETDAAEMERTILGKAKVRDPVKPYRTTEDLSRHLSILISANA